MRRVVCAAVVATSMGFTQSGPQAPTVAIGGDLRQWHKATLTLDGPHADEAATDPNPFRDYGMTVTFALTEATGAFTVGWFDPRNGGALKRGNVASVKAGGPAALGQAPDNRRKTG
jgi:hypothetical protein